MTSIANTYSYPILFHRRNWLLLSSLLLLLLLLLLVVVLVVGVTTTAAPSNGVTETGGGGKITSYDSDAMQSYQWDGIYSRGNVLSNKVLQQKQHQQRRNLQRGSDEEEESAKTAMQQCHSYLQEEILSEEPEDIVRGNNNDTEEDEEEEDEFECGYCQSALDDDTISFIQCGYPNCQYCNEDETICGLDTSQMTFTSPTSTSTTSTSSSTTTTINTANIVPNYLKFQYIRGRKEEVVLYYPNDGTCYVEIDGIKCRYCGAVNCPKRGSSNGNNNGNDFRLDCTNLSVLYDDDDNLTYECGVGHSVFQFLYDPNFLSCVDYDETLIQLPTSAPDNYNDNNDKSTINGDGDDANKGDVIELDDPLKKARSSGDICSINMSTAITTTMSAMIVVALSLFASC